MDFAVIKDKSICDCSLAEAMVKYIYEDLDNIKRNFVDIAVRLNEAYRYSYYKVLGFDNIETLAETAFGFKRSTTYNFINLAFAFCDGMHLKQQYNRYSQTQLVEMLTLPECARLLVRPEDTVARIKEYKALVRRCGFYNVHNAPYGDIEGYIAYHSKGELKNESIQMDKSEPICNDNSDTINHLIQERKVLAEAPANSGVPIWVKMFNEFVGCATCGYLVATKHRVLGVFMYSAYANRFVHHLVGAGIVKADDIKIFSVYFEPQGVS